jgi:GH15 family glucan-1,4-alpha-glucosidase
MHLSEDDRGGAAPTGLVAPAAVGTRPPRDPPYVPIRDYAAIGDGRTVALVALDGSIDWLCLPDLDSPSAFAALLDPDRGGRFALAPEVPFSAERRYLPDTNVLETTFTTAGGAVRVTDAMLLPGPGLASGRELLRRVEGLAGEVPMRWSVEPRFGYGAWRTRITGRVDVPVATARSDALAIRSWDAGDPELRSGSVEGHFRALEGGEALVALGAAHGEPLVLPPRRELEARLDGTIDFWRGWAAERRYEGPWREAVVRSALALKLLIYAPSGAIAAAATTSLPEAPGGERNWDYRYCWVRDSAFTLDALLRLGCPGEGSSFFWWLLHASQLTHPRLRVLYRLNGGPRAPEREVSLAGYERSSPVRVGNEAATQLQLDVYGHLLATASLYCEAGGELDRDTAKRLAGTADLVSDIWRQPDSGIWEVRAEPRHYTESKMMCWVALDRALALAERGRIPAGGAERWRREAEAIRRFIEERCWSEELGSYAGSAGSADLDASLLLGILMGYDGPGGRLEGTTQRVAQTLGDGSLLYRYRVDDGLAGEEGAFLACSFWLVDALARQGRAEEAAARFEDLIAFANDAGLYAEEIEPRTGEFLGNFPQGLVHLALVNAAVSVEEAQR